MFGSLRPLAGLYPLATIDFAAVVDTGPRPDPYAAARRASGCPDPRAATSRGGECASPYAAAARRSPR